MAHPCPARDCPRSIPRGLIACDDHWHQLPTPLRREWIATHNTPRSMRHSRCVIACIEWLQNRSRTVQ